MNTGWEEFAARAAALGAPLSAAQVAQFAAYEALLLEWNERIALTAIREPRQLRVRHFLDALSCVAATGPLDGQSLIDVGSGAGLPGLPLKILYPDLRLTLVDSVAKKARFLELVAAELGLREVAVIAERAEVLGQQPAHREGYDWATARAVAELPVLAELLLPLVPRRRAGAGSEGGERGRGVGRRRPSHRRAGRRRIATHPRPPAGDGGQRTTSSSSTRPPRPTLAIRGGRGCRPSGLFRFQGPGSRGRARSSLEPGPWNLFPRHPPLTHRQHRRLPQELAREQAGVGRGQQRLGRALAAAGLLQHVGQQRRAAVLV